MSQANLTQHEGLPNGRWTDPSENDEAAIDADATLELLSDDHARRLLDELDGEPLSATELAARLDSSRATVYRRLDSLEDAGLVRSAMSVRADGHHRRRYRVVVDRVRLEFGSDGLTIEASDRVECERDIHPPLHS
ncbi:transcriptional regulator [Natrinema saccharevitans]|uniref:Transcriptional regulator n=1 Tax=Natrinema saccharevitans TaxID=301967 RepID=A0A1S8ARY0_9EURY|nr:helix-turn-helix domain-containing protein [Natrinema saccharevitans]OLZ39274.1 transcriptional regulator [Natrinema saccharevitans]